jgi:hypothetical protein
MNNDCLLYTHPCCVDDLTKDHMHQIHGNGEPLARRNSRLGSTSMIFGSNSLVLQNQVPNEKREQYLNYFRLL